MMVRKMIAGMTALLFVLVSPAAHAVELQPGQWQDTETGLEDGKPVPPEVSTSCLTPEEAKDPVKAMQLDKEAKGQCKTLDVKQGSNSLSIRMECGDGKQFGMQITADYVFQSSTSYTGTMKSAVTFGGKTMTMDKKVVAKRIGECKK